MDTLQVDLLCVSAATAGLYYLEHLPVLSGESNSTWESG